MKIAVGNSRMDKKWKNRDISWEDLCEKVSVTQRTTETVDEYRKLKKGAQDSIKDVGGFVGGMLREGRRRNGTVTGILKRIGWSRSEHKVRIPLYGPQYVFVPTAYPG